MFRRRVDPNSFQPFIDLCVSINPERILDRMALQGITREESITQLVDEALAQLRADALDYLNHGVTNVQSAFR